MPTAQNSHAAYGDKKNMMQQAVGLFATHLKRNNKLSRLIGSKLRHRDLVARTGSGVARADVIDRVLMRAVEEAGLSLFDDGVVDRVIVEHDGPMRARIVVDGVPVTPWWCDRSWSVAGRRLWTYEPEP